MVRKIGLIFLTMLFCGTLAWSHVYAAHNHSAAATEKQTAQETAVTVEKPACPYVGGGAACKCGKDCPCPHCKTGQGPCGCMAEAKGCPCMGGDTACKCGKDCPCSHCKTGQGPCACKAEAKGCPCMGGDTACKCGKDCPCPHCKTGQGPCACKAEVKGCPRMGGDTACKCGENCPCPHCKTGQGSCACKAGVKECPCPMRSGKMMAAADTPAKTPQKPTDESSYAQTMMSKQGTFKVTYTSEPAVMPIGQIISWKLKVQAPDGKPITDAAITVDGDMPEHGHGLPTAPKVTQNIGDGTYLVGGIKFSMPGWWTMTFTIKSGDRADSVTFNLQLK